MRRIATLFLMTIGILLAGTPSAYAELQTISWNPVTTYTDGTSIDPGNTVTYLAYWTTDPALGSLSIIGASITTTSTAFDPDLQGMTGGETVYFSAKAFLDTGEVSALSPAYAWVVPLVSPPPAVLTGIAVSGPPSVNEGGTGTYTAMGTWNNGTTAAISPTWNESSSYTTISAGGVLAASAVTSNQAVTVTAIYGEMTGTRNVTIVDVTTSTPAAPKNTGVTGPFSTGGTQFWRFSWDPVTTYANDAPLEPERTVRYTAYWTDDPALSIGSLRTLASSTSATAIDFEPIRRMMTKNQRTYLTVRALLDNGEESAPAIALKWVAANSGPTPPGGGSIKKK